MAFDAVVVIAGFMAGEEIEGSRQRFSLAVAPMPVTIGRGGSSSIVIGNSFGDSNASSGISATHATIERFDDGSVVLRDGNGKASTNGIWHDGERIDRIDLVREGCIVLANPVVLSRFGSAEVRLWLERSGKLTSSALDTNSGHELLGGVQKQSEHLAQQIWTMGEQLKGFEEQLALRQELDIKLQKRELRQDESIKQLSRTVRRSVAVGIFSIAIAFLSNGVFTAMDPSKQKTVTDWAETIGVPLLLAGTGWQLQRQKSKGDED